MTPTSSSTPASRHRAGRGSRSGAWPAPRRSLLHRARRAQHRRAPRRPSRTAPDVRLVHEPRPDAPSARLRRRAAAAASAASADVAHQLRRGERQAVAVARARHCLAARANPRRRPSALASTAAASSRAAPGDVGAAANAGGRARATPWRAAAPRARAASSGKANDRDPGVAQARGRIAARQEAGRRSRAVATPAASAIAAAAASGSEQQRRHVDDRRARRCPDRPASVATASRGAARRVASPSTSTRVRTARRPASASRSASAVAPPARAAQAGRVGGVGEQDRRAAAVGDDAEPRARGSGCDASSAATSSSSRSCRCGSRRPGRRARRRVASDAATSAPVCEPAARAPAADRPALTATIGLVRADAARDAREAARVAERLEIQRDHVGRRVLLPPLEQVVARDVGAIADRDEGARARCRARGPARARRSPTPPLWESSATSAAIGTDAANVGVEPRARDAEAVRADQAHAGRRQKAASRVPARAARRVLEAGRDHEQRGDALARRIRVRPPRPPRRARAMTASSTGSVDVDAPTARGRPRGAGPS